LFIATSTPSGWFVVDNNIPIDPVASTWIKFELITDNGNCAFGVTDDEHDGLYETWAGEYTTGWGFHSSDKDYMFILSDGELIANSNGSYFEYVFPYDQYISTSSSVVMHADGFNSQYETLKVQLINDCEDEPMYSYHKATAIDKGIFVYNWDFGSLSTSTYRGYFWLVDDDGLYDTLSTTTNFRVGTTTACRSIFGGMVVNPLATTTYPGCDGGVFQILNRLKKEQLKNTNT